MLMLKEFTEEKIKSIKTEVYYKEYREDIEEYAKEQLEKPIPLQSYYKFRLFFENGNRDIYEADYFLARRRLSAFAFMCLMGEEEKYLEALEESMWTICNEFTWALPAHIAQEDSIPEMIGKIDLFGSQTGFILGEICSMLDGKLSSMIVERARHEADRRIIKPFLYNKKRSWWEEASNNWAAVCGCSTLASFLYFADEEEKKAVIPKCLKIFENYINGFGDDGCCTEGAAYWNFGFGHFVMAAELLRIYSQGEIDLFKNEKVRTIACFQQKIRLQGGVSVSVSDGGKKFSYGMGLTHFLSREYAEVIVPEKEFARAPITDFDDWTVLIRNFLWSDESAANKKYALSEMDIFEDAAWYIRRTDKYAFMAKAGHNDEFHNHNDVGSFIFCADKKQIICDIGAGEYCRDYFNTEGYKFLVKRSLGHGVPYINGTEQKEGRRFGGKFITQSKDEASMEISGAYPVETLKGLKRSFRFEEDRVIMRDEYSFSEAPTALTERLVTPVKPEVKGNKVLIDNHSVSFDEKSVTVSINSETYRTHDHKDATAYFIDFVPKKLETDFAVEFVIE